MKDFGSLADGNLGAMGGNFGAGAQLQPEDPLMQAFRMYAKARDEFHASCHGLVDAQKRRAVAEQQLAQLSEQLTEAVRVNLIDPTQPQPSPNIPNGAWQNAQQQRYPGETR